MSDEKSGLLSNKNVQLAIIGGGAYWLYSGGEIPDWTILAASALVVAGIAAAFATGRIEALLPDDPRVWLVQVNAKSDEPLAVWSLTPDAFSEMDVKWGPLYRHDHAVEEVYEVYAYDEETNTAVGTWRRSVPGHELVGRFDVDDVLDVVGELRGDLEPEARRGEAIRQALPAIARTIKYEAMQSQNAALDPGRAMDVGQRSPDDVLRDHLPDDLLPGRLKNGDLRDLLEAQEDETPELEDSLALLDDTRETESETPPVEMNGSQP
jgi:hypothetical protein